MELFISASLETRNVLFPSSYIHGGDKLARPSFFFNLKGYLKIKLKKKIPLFKSRCVDTPTYV